MTMKVDGVMKPSGAASSQQEAEVGRMLAGATRGKTGQLPFDLSMVSTAVVKQMMYLSH